MKIKKSLQVRTAFTWLVAIGRIPLVCWITCILQEKKPKQWFSQICWIFKQGFVLVANTFNQYYYVYSCIVTYFAM